MNCNLKSKCKINVAAHIPLTVCIMHDSSTFIIYMYKVRFISRTIRPLMAQQIPYNWFHLRVHTFSVCGTCISWDLRMLDD